MKLKTILLSTALIVGAIQNSSAQFALKTFGKFEKVKAAPDKPIDFKTNFSPRAQVYVELAYPEEPAFYTINCYQVDESGKEKLTGTTDIKCFEKKSSKLIKSNQSLGMMYNAGNYKLVATRQSDKATVAEASFTVTEEVAAAKPVAEVIFCDDTDDKFNPIKPTTTIKAGEGVNFLAKLKDGIGAKFFIWAAFEIRPDGDEVLYKDMQENVDNETNRWFATINKTVFQKPGKYAVYMLPQNATNSGMTVNKPTTYYAKGIITVK